MYHKPSFFRRLFRPKNAAGRRFREEMAKQLDRRTVKYVTERKAGEDSDTVIGRAGEILRRGDEILVIAGDGTLFRGKIADTAMSELMSLEGVIFEGEDLEHGGKRRKIIAYYTYYLKTGSV